LGSDGHEKSSSKHPAGDNIHSNGNEGAFIAAFGVVEA